MYDFCTITTADHLFKTLALRDSLMAISAEARLHVLCIDALPADTPSGPDIVYYTLDGISRSPVAQRIRTKYGASKDKLRWSMKPVFLLYLLDTTCEKAIYLDNDLYFFGDYKFLFDSLDSYDFLLTPHHYPRDPNKDQNWLEANFRVGLYNAGFVAVNKNAINSLEWWAECCAYRCEKNPLRGTFDDQKYLDLIPVMNEKSHILRHKGCNVAEWNRSVISRSEKDGQVYLDEVYPLVFIHFNGTTIRVIEQGEEPLLKNKFAIYLTNLKKYKPEVEAEDLYSMPGIVEGLKYRIWKTATDASL